LRLVFFSAVPYAGSRMKELISQVAELGERAARTWRLL